MGTVTTITNSISILYYRLNRDNRSVIVKGELFLRLRKILLSLWVDGASDTPRGFDGSGLKGASQG